jgi:hypothetical protein
MTSYERTDSFVETLFEKMEDYYDTTISKDTDSDSDEEYMPFEVKPFKVSKIKCDVCHEFMHYNLDVDKLVCLDAVKENPNLIGAHLIKYKEEKLTSKANEYKAFLNRIGMGPRKTEKEKEKEVLQNLSEDKIREILGLSQQPTVVQEAAVEPIRLVINIQEAAPAPIPAPIIVKEEVIRLAINIQEAPVVVEEVIRVPDAGEEQPNTQVIERPVNNVQSNTCSNKQVYKCGVCRNTYSCKNYLSKHVCKPPGTNNFHCSSCNKPFMYKSILKRHERVCKDIDIPLRYEFELDESKLIIFDTFHFTPAGIIDTKSNDGPVITSVNILEYIFSNPANICFTKHSTSEYNSYIYKGNNVWEKVLDSYLFPLLVSTINKYLNQLYDELYKLLDKNADGIASIPLPMKRIEEFIDNINNKSRMRDYIDLTHELKEYLVKRYKSKRTL